MAVMDNLPKSYFFSESNNRLESTIEKEGDDAYDQCLKNLAARKLEKLKNLSSSDSQATEEPTAMILANHQDVDLVKPQPPLRRTRKRKQPKQDPIWMQNLKGFDKFPNSYLMDVRCNGCFFVSTVHSHPHDYRVCPMCHLILVLPSKIPGDVATLYKGTFWRKTEKVFSGFVYGPLPPN